MPDIAYKEFPVTANQALVKFLAISVGATDSQFYEDLIDEAHEKLGILRDGSEEKSTV